MLFVTGLLTLLAIAHAGGDHHIKGASSVGQEKIAQEDIVPSPYSFNIKSGLTYGTKIIREETGDSDGRVKGSYTVDSPRGTSRVVQYRADETGFHANVKTSEPNIKTHSPANAQIEVVSKTAPVPAIHRTEILGKPHSSPGTHHAVSTPVVQDQVQIDEPSSDSDYSRGIKMLKTAASRKTPFASQNIPVKEPVVLSAIQTVKTTHDHIADSSSGTKSLKTSESGKTRFTSHDSQERDPIARPAIQTVKTIKNPTIPRDVIPQYISERRNTFGTTSLSSESGLRTTSGDAGLVTGIYSRRQQRPELKIVNENGEIIINEETLKELQNIGGIVHENGEITMNEDAMQIIQRMGGVVSEQQPSVSLSSSNVLNRNIVLQSQQIQQNRKPVTVIYANKLDKPDSIAKPVLQTLVHRQPESNQFRRVSTDRRTNTQSTNMRSGFGSFLDSTTGGSLPQLSPINLSSATATSQYDQRQGTAGAGVDIISSNANTVLFNGKEISIDGLRSGQLFDENLQPILSENSETVKKEAEIYVASQAARPPSRSSLTQTVSTMSRTGSIQGSRAGIVSGSLPSANIEKKKATMIGVRPSSAQSSRQRTSSEVTPNYLTRQIVSGAVTSHNIPVSGQSNIGHEQTVTSLNANTVLFNGKEISVDQLRAGQLFDENLQPIPSLNPEAVRKAEKVFTIPQAAGPESRSRHTPAFSSASRTGSVQGLRTGILAGSERSGPSSSAYGSRQTTSSGGVSNYLTRQRISGIVKPQVNLASGQSTIGGRQVGQTITSSNANTVLFNGKEINIDQLRAGQLFDENLQPILSVNRETAKKETKIYVSPQIIKPATRSRNIQPISTASRIGSVQGSRTGIVSVSHQGVISNSASGSPQRTSSGVASNYNTGQRKPDVRISQISPASGGSTFGSRQVGQTITSSNANTVLFNGKEINIDQLRAGQLFDENLQPILSVNTETAKKESKVSVASQAAKPASQSHYTQRVSTASRMSAVQGSRTGILSGSQGAISSSAQGSPQITSSGVTSNYLTDKSISGVLTSQLTPGLAQSIIGSSGVGQTLTSSDANTVLFNGKEIRIDQLHAGQLFDENLQPIWSVNPEAAKKEEKIFITPQVAKPAISAPLRTGSITGLRTGVLSGTRQFVPSRLALGGRHIIPSGVVSNYLTGQRISGIVKQPQVNLASGQSTIGNRQTGEAITALNANTVLFNGKEINIDQLQAGQLFDENLQPILSAKLSVDPQSLNPEGRSRYTQTVSAHSRTGAVQASRTDINSGARQDAISVSPQGSPSPARSTFGSRQVGQTITSSNANTVIFNGKEINIDQLQAGQLFDENLQPILSVNPESAKDKGKIFVTPQVAKPASRSQYSPAVSALSRTGSVQGLRTGVLSGTRQVVPSRSVQGSRQTLSGGLISNYLTGQRISGIVKPQVNLASGQSTIGTRQAGEAITALNPSTVLFNGKEIHIDQLQAGQLFDENLQPILSVNRETAKKEATVSVAPQAINPESRSRYTQTISTASRTGVLQASRTGTISGSRQGATSVSAHGGLRRTSSGVASNYLAGQRISGVVTPQIFPASGGSTIGTRQVGQTLTSSNANTVLFNGKEIQIDQLRAGQLFDENLQPILSVDHETAKKAEKAPVVLKAAKPASQLGYTQTVSTASRTSGMQGSRIGIFSGSHAGAISNAAQGIPQRTSSGVATNYLTRQRAPATSQIAANVGRSTIENTQYGQTITSSNANTVLFNGKEIHIDQIRAGQLFDANLQPIMSVNPEMDIRKATMESSGYLTNQRIPVSGTSRITPAQNSFGSSQIGISSGVDKSSSDARFASSIGDKTSQDFSSATTIYFNGKEINVEGLKAGQIFDEHLQPILTVNSQMAKTDEERSGVHDFASEVFGLRSSGLQTQRSGPGARIGEKTSSRSDATSLRSGIRMFGPSVGGRLGASSQSSIQGSTTHDAQSSGSVLYGGYPTTDVRVSGFPAASQRAQTGGLRAGGSRIAQGQITQDELETKIIQEKQNIPFFSPISDSTQQNVIQVKQSDRDITQTVPGIQLSQKSLAPTESKQTQIILEDIQDQRPIVDSFKVGQTDIGDPSIQQETAVGDFSGYLPKASFLPNFNYGVPQIPLLKSVIKTPIAQEQQQVEQVFV